MQTNELAAHAVCPEKKWCPRCAAFQLATNTICEKCAGPMARRTNGQISRGTVTLTAWSAAALLSLILVAVFHEVGIIIVGIFAAIFAIAWASRDGGGQMSAYGPINAKLICPHCQTQGKVRARLTERKAGISGGKATAALLTGGISLLATGLSRKQQITEARCGECSSVWQF